MSRIYRSSLRLLSDSDVTASPLTVVFQRAGFGAAAHVVNAVLLTAVLSATNSLSFEMMKAGVGWALGSELCSLTQLNMFIDCSILVARSQDIPSGTSLLLPSDKCQPVSAIDCLQYVTSADALLYESSPGHACSLGIV